MGLNNRAADTESHTGAAFLGRKESVEYLSSLVRGKSDASVFDRYQKLFVAIVLGAESELARAVDGLHGVDAVDNQVQLTPVAVGRGPPPRPVDPLTVFVSTETGVLVRLVTQKNFHLANQIVDIQALLSHYALREKQLDPVNDLRCSVCVTNYP